MHNEVNIEVYQFDMSYELYNISKILEYKNKAMAIYFSIFLKHRS